MNRLLLPNNQLKLTKALYTIFFFKIYYLYPVSVILIFKLSVAIAIELKQQLIIDRMSLSVTTSPDGFHKHHSDLVENIGVEEPASTKGCWGKSVERVGNLLKDEGDKVRWLENMRGNLSLVASIITTMTFQLAMNPPGGIVQVNKYII